MGAIAKNELRPTLCRPSRIHPSNFVSTAPTIPSDPDFLIEVFFFLSHSFESLVSSAALSLKYVQSVFANSGNCNILPSAMKTTVGNTGVPYEQVIIPLARFEARWNRLPAVSFEMPPGKSHPKVDPDPRKLTASVTTSLRLLSLLRRPRGSRLIFSSVRRLRESTYGTQHQVFREASVRTFDACG